MSMVPEKRICPRCKRAYSWNPDVGRMFCPHCGGLGKAPETVLDKLFKKKKKEKDND